MKKNLRLVDVADALTWHGFRRGWPGVKHAAETYGRPYFGELLARAKALPIAARLRRPGASRPPKDQ